MLRLQTLADRYQLQRQIGVGGMARVYLAWDAVLHRNVAVKVLNEAASADPAFVARFRREAQAAGGLQSPNIVQVYDWGRILDGEWPIYYLVMEYVAGPNLKEVIRERGALPEGEALRIAAGIAAALEVAHRQGIIHRDIKPQNVLLGQGGTVKVADFGIARAMGLTQLTTTQSGVYGSAHYLSPEQAQRGAADQRSDIYSLGVVLYEMLTGHEPFRGESLLEVALQHVSGEATPPGQVHQGISAETDAIVMKALTKDPAERFSNAAAMRHALMHAHPDTRRRAPAPHPSTPPTATPSTRTAHAVHGARPRSEVTGGSERHERQPHRRLIPSWLPLLAATLLVLGAGLGVLHALSGIGSSSHHAAARQPTATKSASAGHARASTSTSPKHKRHVHPTAAPAPRRHGAAGTGSQVGQRKHRSGGPGQSPSTGHPAASSPVSTAPALAAPLPTAAATAVQGPPAPGASQGDQQAQVVGGPQQTVLAFYADVGSHDFGAAAQLWTPSLRNRDPPPTYIDDRFAATSRIDVVRSATVSVMGDRATVDVTLVEHLQNGATRTLVGAWDLVRLNGMWLLDTPRF
jgi:serine/threonine protein kinase